MTVVLSSEAVLAAGKAKQIAINFVNTQAT